MFGGIAFVVPLLILVAGGLATVVASRRTVPSHELPVEAAIVRDLDARASVRGVVVGLLVAAALGALGVTEASPGLFLVAPLTGAAVHAGLAYLHECSLPVPTGRLRTARLTARSVRDSAPLVLSGIGAAAAVIVVAACVGGIAVAGFGTDTYTWTTWNGSWRSGNFPGGLIAIPLLVAGVATVVSTAAVLHRVPDRPAVPRAEGWVDTSLRRTSAHRVVRVSAAALVGTAGALLVLWSNFTRTYGTTFDATLDPTLNRGNIPGPLDAWSTPLTTVGILVVLAGFVVLALPARGLRAPEPLVKVTV